MKDSIRENVSSFTLFTTLLKRTPSAQIKEFLEEAALADGSMVHRFILHAIDHSSLPSGEKYQWMIKSILQLTGSESSESFSDRIQNLTTKAHRFIESGNYLDAYYIAASILSEEHQVPSGYEEIWKNGRITALEILRTISGSEAGYDLKEKIFQFLLSGTKNLSHLSVAPQNWFEALLDSAAEEKQLTDVLQLTGDLQGSNRNQFGEVIDQHEEEQLLQLKVLVLSGLNRMDEIHHLLEAHKEVKPFRLRLIESCIEQGDFTRAKELIREGRRLEERKGKIYENSDWDLLLLRIAITENDVKAIRNVAFSLFIKSDFDFQYYHLLKRQYDPGRWKQQVDRIVNLLRKEDSYAVKGIHAAAGIFTEEKDWTSLLRLLQKNANLEFVELYADLLKEKFPEELLEIYRRAVRRFAEKFMGPEAYKMVADTLRKMQSLPGGRKLVQSLAIELKVNYRLRRSFVDELNKVAL